MRGNCYYGTEQELKFLEQIGSFHEPPEDRGLLLRQYQAAMQLRQDWERIDRGVVAAALAGMIRETS
jgi:hypothetical protein